MEIMCSEKDSLYTTGFGRTHSQSVRSQNQQNKSRDGSNCISNKTRRKTASLLFSSQSDDHILSPSDYNKLMFLSGQEEKWSMSGFNPGFLPLKCFPLSVFLPFLSDGETVRLVLNNQKGLKIPSGFPDRLVWASWPLRTWSNTHRLGYYSALALDKSTLCVWVCVCMSVGVWRSWMKPLWGDKGFDLLPATPLNWKHAEKVRSSLLIGRLKDTHLLRLSDWMRNVIHLSRNIHPI